MPDRREVYVKLRRRVLWSAGAKVAGLGVAALAVTLVVSSLRGLSPFWRSHWSIAAIELLSVLFTLLVAAGLLWGAWRLWRRWSPGTVRIVTAVATAWIGLYVHRVLFEMVYGEHVPVPSAWAWQVSFTPLLLVAVVVYRKASRTVIRWADVQDPLDPHGHPSGHMERVRAFCAMLGISVWLGASSVAMAVSGAGMRLAGAIGTVASMALGWAVYRITLWWMTPPTQPALPPGGGFDVLPVQGQRNRDIPE